MIQVHEPSRSLLISSPDPLAIREVIKSSRIITDVSDFNVAVKHNVGNVRILRNLGYDDTPSPIMSYYCWPGKYKPYDHQMTMAEFHTLHHRLFNLSEMGAMKTAATLWAADWLMNEGKVKKALILAPLSILERVWMADIFDTLMHRQIAIIHGTPERRKKRLDSDVDFYIMNHDKLAIKDVTDYIHRRPDINLVIVDEGSVFRNSNTDRYRGLEKMLRPDMRLWWLTGTPAPNAPTDVWAQARLVNGAGVPKFFGQFRDLTMYPHQKLKHKWEARDDAYQTAYSIMQPAIRFLKKDVIDLPPMLPPRNWQAPLSTEQKRAFKDMKNQMTAEIKRADQTGETISAVNAADKITKLRQILCGAMRHEDGSYLSLPHKGRTQLVLDAFEQASAKVIVVVPFKGILNDLAKEIGVHYTVGVLNGDVPIAQRNQIITQFKTSDSPHGLLCHPKVMSHGLNLTEADTLVFYAPIYSNDEYQQVLERFNRVGQKHAMNVIRIGAHSLEWAIYQTLDERGQSQESILKLYRRVATEKETNDG